MRITVAIDGFVLPDSNLVGWSWVLDKKNWECGFFLDGSLFQAQSQALFSFARQLQGISGSLGLLTSSNFLAKTINQWRFRWRENDWRKIDGLPLSNKPLIQGIDHALSDRDVYAETMLPELDPALMKAHILAREAAYSAHNGEQIDFGPGLSAQWLNIYRDPPQPGSDAGRTSPPSPKLRGVIPLDKHSVQNKTASSARELAQEICALVEEDAQAGADTSIQLEEYRKARQALDKDSATQRGDLPVGYRKNQAASAQGASVGPLHHTPPNVTVFPLRSTRPKGPVQVGGLGSPARGAALNLESIVSAVRRADKRFIDACTRADRKAVQQFLHPDFSYVGAWGSQISFTEAVDMLSADPPTPDEMEIRELGPHTAQVVYYELERIDSFIWTRQSNNQVSLLWMQVTEIPYQ